MCEIWKCVKVQQILDNDYAAIIDSDSFHFCQMQEIALEVQTDFTLEQFVICLLWFPCESYKLKTNFQRNERLSTEFGT